LRRERADEVGGAAEFEGAAVLEVFAFEKELEATDLDADDGGAANEASDAVRGG
jgi:hypothetical protein